MRFFPATLVIIPLLHFQAPASDPPSNNADQEPVARALSHLRNLRDRPLEADRDFTLLGEITREKKQLINEQLESYHQQLRGSDLTVIKHKTTDKLAGVLIAQQNDLSPTKIHVHGVALIRLKEEWTPAPLFSSFENIGLRYIPGLSESAREIETWMSTESTRETTRLRQRAQKSLLEAARRAVTRDELLESTPEDVLLAFFRACRQRDLPTALAYVGGLDDPLPPSWQESLAFLSEALNATHHSSPEIQQLLSPKTMHVVMHHDTQRDRADISLGEYHPAPASESDSPNPWRLRHFSLERSEAGLWRVTLPDWFFNPKLADSGQNIDLALRESIPLAILNADKPTPFPSAEALFDSLSQALDKPSPADFLAHFEIPDDTSPAKAAGLLGQLSEIFQPPHSPFARAFLLDFHHAEHQAAALYTAFNPSQPAIATGKFRLMKFVESDSGWSLDPNPNPTLEEDFHPDLVEWVEQTKDLSESEWLTQLGFLQLPNELPTQTNLTPKDIKAAVTRWTRALELKSPRRIFSATSTFNHPDSLKRLLSYLQQELPTDSRFELLKIHTHGRWAAATIRHSLVSNSPPFYILHPIALTRHGPRILPEAILYSPDSRAQQLLNQNTYRHLEKFLSEPEIAELKHLHKLHTKFVAEH